ncbi:hypothetical protein WJ74_17900 [Burkholderia ubonensis]|uniref:ATP-binding protein n=1 Tax=Burkholderia ubonensis TaxID=101571 RepID=UPI00075876F1|nr:ATP-binding protein [Burkholderia ubonensis]KVO33523.1 hypothetical protein WJ74_17900 [Burkholderia ubonensis]
MSRFQTSTVLSIMRRYQRFALFGGGMVLTVMAIVTLGFAAAAMVHAHIENERRDLTVEARRMIGEILKAEMALRSTIFLAELVWSQRVPASRKEVTQFRADGGRLVLQRSSGLHSVLFASPTPQASPPELGHFVSLTDRLSDRLAATAIVQGYQFSSYLYTPSRDLIAASPFPWPARAQINTALTDRHALFDTLTQVGGKSIAPATINDPQNGLRAVRWLSPYRNPLTGVLSLRMSIYGLDAHNVPFAVFVSEIPLTVTVQLLSIDRFEGIFAIIDQGGEPIATSERGKGRADILAAAREAAGASGVATQRANNGVFVVSAPLATTGWRLVYATGWRDLVTGVWPEIRPTLVLTLTLILALWVLLWWFNRRVFAPMLERSERVVETERLNRMLIDTAPIGLGVIDADSGRPILRSPVMIDVASKVETEARTLSAQIAGRYARQDGNAVVRDELSLITRDGAQLDLAVSLAPARYRNTDVLVTAFLDVTEKRRTEQALRDAKQEADVARQAADDANRAKSLFLATMSHEIRTPLNAILGNLELVQRMGLPSEAGARVHAVTSSSTALLDIINDVLDFSKIEAGQLSTESIPFDLAAVVRDVAAIFAPVAHAKGLQFDGIVDDSVSSCYVGDPTRVRQIASNLLSNAIKFTAHGDVVIEVYAKTHATGGPGVAIGVSDSGIGMSAAQQARLFEPFVQADSTITRRFGGSGLGLALCRRLVELMNGTITLQSALGEGSQFVVWLPLVATDAPALDASGPVVTGPAMPTGLNVLAVDDQLANRELIRMQLETLGHRVELADNGGDALRRFNEHAYDALLTDISMPGMDGYALARCLRAQGATVPIVALTAHAEIEEQRRCSEAGIDAVLVKPVLLDALEATLRRLLRTQAPAMRPTSDDGIGAERLPVAVQAAMRDSTHTLLTSLNAALQTGDRESVLRDLHALRGTFAMIRELAVADACAGLEQEARQRDLNDLQPALDRLASLAWAALARRGA